MAASVSVVKSGEVFIMPEDQRQLTPGQSYDCAAFRLQLIEDKCGFRLVCSDDDQRRDHPANKDGTYVVGPVHFEFTAEKKSDDA